MKHTGRGNLLRKLVCDGRREGVFHIHMHNTSVKMYTEKGQCECPQEVLMLQGLDKKEVY